MAEFYTLRFRKEGKMLYAARGSQFDGAPDNLWYIVKSSALAYRFRSPGMIHHLLRGPRVFRDLLMASAAWEIVHSTERVIESGVSNIRVLQTRSVRPKERSE